MKCPVYVMRPYGSSTVTLIKDEKAFRKTYKDLTTKEIPVKLGDGITCILENDTDWQIIIGWFKPHKISTLAHECSHAAFRICGHYEVELTADNNEAHAYLISDMMDFFLGKRK